MTNFYGTDSVLLREVAAIIDKDDARPACATRLRTLAACLEQQLPQLVYVCVQDAHGYVLAVRSSLADSFGLPGGKVEPGELHAQAAVRTYVTQAGFLIKGERVVHGEVQPNPEGVGLAYATYYVAQICSERRLSSGLPSWISQRELLAAGGPTGAVLVRLFEAIAKDPPR